LHLSMLDPKKFWMHLILTCKTIENNMIFLRDWKSHLKKLYKSPKVVDNIQTLYIEEEFFSIEDIEFGVKWFTRGKTKDIEGYQAKILKIARLIFIPHIQKLFNLVMKKGFSKHWNQSLIVLVFKSGDKNNPYN